MDIRKIYVEGGRTGSVVDLGVRPYLVSSGLQFGVKVAPINIAAENKVEVIVGGNLDDIKRYRKYIEESLRSEVGQNDYQISELKDYKGKAPDWVYHASASTLEQVHRGISSLRGIEKGVSEMASTLKGIDTKFDQMIQRFGTISDNLDQVPEKTAEALDARLRKYLRPE